MRSLPLLLALLLGAAPSLGQRAAEKAPAPDAEAPKTDEAPVSAAQAPAKKTTPRWEIGTVHVRGEAPKPGVVFVEAEREQVRRAMQVLVNETRGGAFQKAGVSRPTELEEREARVGAIKTRGALSEGRVLRALGPDLQRLVSCRRAQGKGLPAVDVEIDLELRVDEEGRISSSKMKATRPQAPRAGLCVLHRLRDVTLPASAAGSARVELTVVLPPPLSTTPSAPAAAR